MVPAPISPPPRRWPQGLRPPDVQAPPVGVAWIVGVAMISWRGSGEGLSLLNDLLQGFAFLFCAWAVGGHMAHGDDGHGLIIGRREQVAHDGGVVVAHPAGAQSPFGCGKAQVLRGNGHIDVAMRLVVVAACPARLVVAHANDVERGCAEPLAVVGAPQLLASLGAAHHNQLPRLAVDGRWRQPRTLQNVVEVGVAHGLVGELAGREARLR